MSQGAPFTADEMTALVALREKSRTLRKSGKGKGNSLLSLLTADERELMIRWLCYQMSGRPQQ